ncbi:MAG: hypothetical protein OXM61_00585 [Candidatus Poribacteria bacterium]|nr:hypothetical protein [Candidatus Poribacteria bacterium]
MKIKKTSTEDMVEVDVELDINTIHSISEIKLGQNNELNVKFHEQTDNITGKTKLYNLIFKKCIGFIKEFKWLLGLMGGGTVTGGFLKILHNIPIGTIIPIFVIIIVFILSFKIAFSKRK